MNQKHDYIAVFDSGVGGISVLRHLLRYLPGERFLYFVKKQFQCLLIILDIFVEIKIGILTWTEETF